MQGERDVRARPLPHHQPILCPDSAQTDEQLPGLFTAVFFGSYRYPSIHGGPLLINDSDHPPEWLLRGLGIDDIIGIRAGTICGNSNILQYTEQLRDIALSARPVDVEIGFERPVTFDLSFDGTIAPVGLSGVVHTLDVVGNPVPERAGDRVVSDTDLSAIDTCSALMNSDVNVYRITDLMMAGFLGKRRRFVPTRWAIRAVDDTLGTHLKHQISRFPPLDGIRLLSGEIFGNRIVCLPVPGDRCYEMIEIWERHSIWGENRKR